MKDVRVTKNVKAIKFEELGGELESKKGSRDNNSQNTGTCNRKSLSSVFQEFAPTTPKTFIFAKRLDTRLSFYEV